MPQPDAATVPSAFRPWIHLGLTIHFFALLVCLASNLAPSELQLRLLKLLSPYTVGLHQDYGAVRLEMTRGTDIDFDHQIQFRKSRDEPWQLLAPTKSWADWLDRRWPNFVRLMAIAARDQNDELVYALLEHAAKLRIATGSQPQDVRFLRRATLSIASDRASSSGVLSPAELEDNALYECRVIYLDDGRIRLLPVLKSLRTTKAVEPSDSRP